MSVAPLVPPPPPPPGSLPESRDRPRPAELMRSWRVATALVWGLTFLALCGVWKASRELGLATWWRGPLSEPQPFVITLVPFALPSAMTIAALYGARHLPWFGLLASAVTALVGVVDLGYVTRLGVVEVALGAATAAFSVASLAGMYRRV